MPAGMSPPAAPGVAGARAALLEQRLRGRRGNLPVVPRRPDGVAPPLSFAQERLWFMDQFAPETAAYVVPFPIRLLGPVDVPALRAALDAVVARHEALRMRFPVTEAGRPTVVVEPAAEVPLDVVPLDERLPPAERERVAAGLLADLAAAPFPLATGPLVRATLVRLAEHDHVLLVVVHHIVFDGWSINVFLTDLFAAYAGTPLGPPPTRYGDFAAWQRARYQDDRMERDLAFWRSRLAGVPPLELPTDAPRPPEQTFRGASHPVRFDAELCRSLLELSRRHGVTAYMTLLAAYQALLCRYSGQEEFAIGSTVAGRTLPELERVAGLFANVLPLRADLAGNPTFAELLGRVRDTVLDAFAHQETPFERIVNDLRIPRDVSRSPIFQATFTLLNYTHATTAPPGLTVLPFPVENRVTRFDLELYLYEPADEVTGFFTYNADLFAAESVARLARHLERLLRLVVADPDRRIADLDLLDDAERRRVLVDWNDTARDIGPPATLAELVEAQVARTPDAIAVSYEGGTLTYRDLNARANVLARRLRRHGVGPGTVAAVCVPRSPELVTGLLAVLKAGGAYLPLDPEYPADRLAFMLADAEPRVVLVDATTAEVVPDAGVATIRVDRPAEWDDGTAEARENLPDGAGVDDDAYLIYTSGSTGRPKGVLNTHRAIHNRLDWMQRTYRLGADDVVLQKTPAGFDVSVWEFFWPLLAGARLVLARPGGHKDAAYLRDLIREAGVTTVHFVPSMLAVFVAEEGVERCRSLRRIICSGEELPVRLARTVLERLDCELHNLYGPTEAAIDVSAWQCRADELAGLARVPIGRPIQNIRLYVLDRTGRPVPPGLPGELHIAGVGVARGYLRRPELTAERFRPDPYGPPGARMYATGDLVRHRPDGALEYLGRLDHQVKLRGLRIEPGEIESVLRDQPGVRDAVVVVREDRPGDRRLVAYVVPERSSPKAATEPADSREAGAGDAAPDPVALRAALKTVLPDYMVPGAIVVLERLPLTPNGKLDRQALPAPTATRATGTELTPPRTGVERAIADVWSAVLGVAELGIDDNFFDLGGHSLLATQVVARLRTALPEGAARISVLDLFRNPTIRQLAELAATPATARGPRRLLHELTRPVPAASRRLTLVCVPYGGGSAVVYQPLADALPAGYALYSLAIPGHDVGLDEEHVAFDALVEECVAEIQERISGPVALYGHCGVGGAMAVAIARGLERVGRPVAAVYTGAVFPFARPRGWFAALRARLERFRSDQIYANWLTSLGVDLSDLDPAQVRTLIRSMRQDSEAAEDYFTGLLRDGSARLAAPMISVVGERDDMTLFYQERYREWHFLTDTAALVVLDEAGHYFLKHRAEELATIVTTTHDAIRSGRARPAPRTGPDDTRTWWLHGVSRAGDARSARPEGPAPSMRRFLAVAAGQTASMIGSAMVEFAVPVWIYLRTGSLVQLALFSAVALVPGILVLPFAGTVVDRCSRRAVMLAGDAAALAAQAVFLALLLTDRVRIGHVYALLVVLSVALTFQRLAYSSAIPQLVPKRYLGHANGAVQAAVGVAQFLVPVAAAGLLASIGLAGILAVDVVSYLVVITVVALVRFPRSMPFRRRESIPTEIRTGFRYAMGRRGFRALLVFFAVTNVFLGPLLIMVQPLVLGFATLSTVAGVSVAAGLGATVGGLAMALWGGPVRHRMRGMLTAALGLAVACLVAGSRPSTPVVAVGVFGMFLGLTLMNAIYATIVQVKVPPRFLGRVFAVHTLFAWCTLPIGFVVLGPYVSDTLGRALEPGGPLAGTVGRLVGTGSERGIGLTFVVFALAIAAIVLLAARHPALRHFDRDVPDAEPDDLIGLAELRRRTASDPVRSGSRPDHT
ncbi:non-ribosomal peptide synthetase/MFS transporter [Micromonospora sp. HM5-17]|uniref:non-ribosomal peptide synthetase/MFS transporter n=1 Tax=Micromonospora sp. HM5-17 TaxID=2487710 RepID=UPI001F389BB4|nr:non-ribosomal peptide synthetase [Micromonospora sp. HM5-17]